MSVSLYGPPPVLPAPVQATARTGRNVQVGSALLSVAALMWIAYGAAVASPGRVVGGLIVAVGALLLSVSLRSTLILAGEGFAAERNLRGWSVVHLSSSTYLTSGSSRILGGVWFALHSEGGARVAVLSLHADSQDVLAVLEGQLEGLRMDSATFQRLWPGRDLTEMGKARAIWDEKSAPTPGPAPIRSLPVPLAPPGMSAARTVPVPAARVGLEATNTLSSIR